MSDPETRPLKRTRLSADDPTDSQSIPSGSSPPSSSNLSRHPEIRYEDCNLVLVTRETAFCIYRGLIAAQSTVFSDLFASSTSSPEEMFEGCPVIHLSDSPQDLTHLLRVLLPQSRIHYHTTRESRVPTFDELSAVICLAHNTPTNSKRTLDPWNNAGRHNISVVNLARLTDTPALLPLALYHCTYLGGDLFDGWKREDGTVEHLSGADLRMCIEARAALVHAHTIFLLSVFDATVSEACAHPAGCAACLREGQGAFVCSEELAMQHHPFRYSWVEAVSMLRESGKLCEGCADEMLERTREGQKKIFEKLTKIFGVTVEAWETEQSETDAMAGEGE